MKWVSDSQAGRRFFELPKDPSDYEELKQIWDEGVAKKENSMFILRIQFTGLYQFQPIS